MIPITIDEVIDRRKHKIASRKWCPYPSPPNRLPEEDELDAYVAQKTAAHYSMSDEVYSELALDLPTFVGCVQKEDIWKTRHRQFISWAKLCGEMGRVRRRLSEAAGK